MNFSLALVKIKNGQTLVRDQWKGILTGQAVRMVPGSPGKLPYLEIQTIEGLWVPYQPTQKDLFAEDWSVVEVRE